MPKLLYVDDEFINLQLFKFNFQKHFELYLASSGQEALEIIESEDVSVIISDLKMPEMDGIELVSEIKKKYPEKICFLLSAYYLSEAISMGLNEADIFEYIIKPWKKDELLKTLDKAYNSL